MTPQRLAWCAGTAALLSFVAAGRLHAQPDTILATEGQARFQVVVSRLAAPEVRAAAQTLASHLGLISGAEFVVTSGVGREGIVVGVFSEFSGISNSLAAKKILREWR